MKNIIIKKIRFLNFKCFRDFTVEFDRHATTIRGRNGSGKTTVFDGFTWLLFGKNSDDRKDFGVKTRDAGGNVIGNIPHEVSAVLSVDGEEITLCRRLSEKWQKKRGSSVAEFTGNTEERFYNDVPCSVKEWGEKIDDICAEQVFKFITNPLHFNQQKAEVQRAVLFRMAGDIPDDEIAAGNEDFRTLLGKLTGKTLDEYKKEIAARKRRLKAEIDAIPDCIDERKRDMPEAADWDDIAASIAEKKKQKEECEAQMGDAAKAYSAANDERMRAARQVAALKQRRLSLEDEIRSKAQADYYEALREKQELARKADSLRRGINWGKQCVARNLSALASYKSKREALIAEWRKLNAGTLVFEEKDFVCPTCGRSFEPDEIEARRQEMTRRFNERKAEALAGNNSEGQAVRREMQALESENGELEKSIEANAAELEKLEASGACKADPARPDPLPAIGANEEHRELSRKIAELEREADKPAEAADNAPLKERIKRIDNEVEALKAILANKAVIERNNARVAELERQLRAQSEELAELEGIEFTIAAFTKARAEAVDKRINGMFSLVRFKMRERQINGGEAETCVATVDGIPYPDLNDAKKVNAGLDIINAVCKFEGVTAPIFIDNAESVNRLLDTASQQIRLVVTLDDTLVIENNARHDSFN